MADPTSTTITATRDAPDAALIALCAELEAMARRHDRLCAPYLAANLEAPLDVADAIRRDVPRLDALRASIAATPATTPAGLAAKARAILADAPPDASEIQPEDAATWSLARDVAALVAEVQR